MDGWLIFTARLNSLQTTTETPHSVNLWASSVDVRAVRAWTKSILLQQGDEETGKALHQTDLQFGDGDQLVQQLDEKHMVLFAELPSI